MATIKIGKAENELIDKIEEFKENYTTRLEDIFFGLELAEKQIPDSNDEATKKAREKIKRVKETVQILQTLIEKITFSEWFEEEKFGISWWEYVERTKQYYERSYGKKFGSDYVQEKQFIYVVVSWEKEICKRLVLLKELQGNLSSKFWIELENELHNIIAVYIES